jgi:hypothetical protein
LGLGQFGESLFDPSSEVLVVKSRFFEWVLKKRPVLEDRIGGEVNQPNQEHIFRGSQQYGILDLIL